MKFYSWKDIDRYCAMEQGKWNSTIDSIEVYPSVITVYMKQGHEEQFNTIISGLFNDKYDAEQAIVKLDIGDMNIPIYCQESQETYSKPELPLFKEIIYRSNSYPQRTLPQLSRPTIGFHSYKGGVGRTLSLLAFAKAWSTAFSDDQLEGSRNPRLLIVDADIEAPGLTWLQKDGIVDAFSYLDLLTLIQDGTDPEQIVDLACSKIRTSTLPIETPIRSVDHIFIPTYRYEEQLLDLYATPESIVNGLNKEFILAEVLSRICERMNLGAVLIDLRAGISELSSTLLLDPRVKKYLVTSTSTQSIMGTKMLLQYLLRGLPIQPDTNLPEVLLNMIPDTLSDAEKSDEINLLHQCYEQDLQEGHDLTDHVVAELPFASELIHGTSLQQILRTLNGREMYFRLEKLVKQSYKEEPSKLLQPFDDDERKRILKNIHDLAHKQLTAESNGDFQILMTEPLKQLGRRFCDSIPTTVIMGAKGAGKTFLYRKMIEAQDWNSFCSDLYGSELSEPNGYFLPVIATRNSNELVGTLKNCINHLKEGIPGSNVSNSVFLDNRYSLEAKKSHETDWLSFWEELLSSSFDSQTKRFADVHAFLQSKGKRIVFLIDGLEEILQDISTKEVEQKAIQVLCQDVVSLLAARYETLGIVVFLRRDMARSSILVNFKQFEQTYKYAELKWSSNEALRLAVWLISQAHDSFYTGTAEIGSASQEVIEDQLIRLWGMKLGKPTSNEAYSSRWILAALSDFNGQLQARDIIRFLSYATENPGRRPPYNDRLIMPTEIRTAVSRCSEEKLGEVKQEYSALKPIFEKLEQLPTEEKSLPLDAEHAKLDIDDEKLMIAEGYLKRDGDKYYLPEIIRHALGFKYGKGARPKVLSLMFKS